MTHLRSARPAAGACVSERTLRGRCVRLHHGRLATEENRAHARRGVGRVRRAPAHLRTCAPTASRVSRAAVDGAKETDPASTAPACAGSVHARHGRPSSTSPSRTAHGTPRGSRWRTPSASANAPIWLALLRPVDSAVSAYARMNSQGPLASIGTDKSCPFLARSAAWKSPLRMALGYAAIPRRVLDR